MREAWSNSDLALLRTRPQSSRWFLAVHVPGSVVQGVIAGPPGAYPATHLNLSTLSGNSATVEPGMTLLIGTAPGASDKGRLRVNRAMSASNIIPTAEYGSGLIVPQAGYYATVINQFLPWTIHSKYNTAASIWEVDGEPLGNQLIDWGPQVNMGPPLVGFLEDGSLSPNDEYVFTGSFVGNRTVFMGGSGSSYLWTFPNGSTATEVGTPLAPVTTNLSSATRNGEYFSLKVTDANGASAIGRRLMFLFNDRSEPMRVEFGEVGGGITTGGYETEIRATGGIDFTNVPDMAEIVIFEEASFGNTASEIGGNFPYRSNIVFRGWIIGETVRINPFDGDVLFRAATIDRILRETESYDAFLADTRYAGVSASNSVPASFLTIDKAAWYLLNKRSTVGQIVDWEPARGMASANDLVIFQDLPRSTLWEQITQNYRDKGILGYVAADMQSNLYAMADVMITGGSQGIPMAMDITRADRRDQIVINRSPADTNSEVQLYSVSSATPYGAQSPGDVAGYFGRRAEHSRGLFVDQQTLTTWAGNYRAKLNSRIKSVIVPLAGNFRHDPVPQSRVRMSLSAIDNPRGLIWNNKEFLGKQLRMTYDALAGGTVSEIEVEENVNGFGGSAITFPRISVLPGPEPGPEWPPFPEPDPTPGPGSGVGTALRLANNHVGLTSNLSAGPSTHWVSKMGNLAGMGLTIYDLILDPWRPSTHCWISTSDGLYRTENYRAETPVWTQIDSSLGITRIHGSINIDGYFGGVFIDSNIVYWRYTTNGGASWNTTQVVAGPSFPSFVAIANPFSGIGVYAPAGQPHIMVTFSTQQSFVYRGRIWKSTNGGITFSEVSILYDVVSGFGSVINPHQAYDNNENGNFWITALNHPAGNTGGLYSTSDGGANWAAYSALGAADFAGFRGAFEPHTFNRQLIYAWIHAGGGEYHLWTSEDGGANWTQATEIGLSGTVYAGGGLPFNEGRSYASTSAGVFYSNDKGETFVNCTGDWAWGHAVGGGHVIVPDWTE